MDQPKYTEKYLTRKMKNKMKKMMMIHINARDRKFSNVLSTLFVSRQFLLRSKYFLYEKVNGVWSLMFFTIFFFVLYCSLFFRFCPRYVYVLSFIVELFRF